MQSSAHKSEWTCTRITLRPPSPQTGSPPCTVQAIGLTHPQTSPAQDLLAGLPLPSAWFQRHFMAPASAALPPSSKRDPRNSSSSGSVEAPSHLTLVLHSGDEDARASDTGQAHVLPATPVQPHGASWVLGGQALLDLLKVRARVWHLSRPEQPADILLSTDLYTPPPSSSPPHLHCCAPLPAVPGQRATGVDAFGLSGRLQRAGGVASSPARPRALRQRDG